MSSQKYIIGVVFFSLLIFGPINHSWPFWLLIRIGYIILIPLLVWLILKWIWKSWKPNKESEERLERALAGATCGALFVLAILAATSKTHIDNTLSVQIRDGFEDIGDYIIQEGANWGGAIALFIFSIIALWYSISRRK